MKSLKTLAAAAVLASTAQITAEARPFTTSKDFLEFCAIEETYNQATCSAYVWGLAEGLRAMAMEYKPDFWCMPPRTNMKELYDAGRDFMLANPDMTHFKPSDLLIQAWRRAYACPNEEGMSAEAK